MLAAERAQRMSYITGTGGGLGLLSVYMGNAVELRPTCGNYCATGGVGPGGDVDVEAKSQFRIRYGMQVGRTWGGFIDTYAQLGGESWAKPSYDGGPRLDTFQFALGGRLYLLGIVGVGLAYVGTATPWQSAQQDAVGRVTGIGTTTTLNHAVRVEVAANLRGATWFLGFEPGIFNGVTAAGKGYSSFSAPVVFGLITPGLF